ncbi:MAG: hypothetical protein IID37_02445 [Planctomycetes bacterium]|nr:hypothetical protein [Planctomycetota bacterium]
MHDTYGFPIDLTEQMAEECGMTVDVTKYEQLMEKARELARTTSKTGVAISPSHFQRLAKTNFVGHESMHGESYVLNIRKGGDLAASVSELGEGEEGALILRETPFYAEQGGQIGDCGEITDPVGAWRFRVDNTQKVNNVYVHLGECTLGAVKAQTPLQVGSTHGLSNIRAPRTRDLAEAKLHVDEETRHATTQNHTSTHVLNWALRKVLGDHVQQKGSLVDPDKTRFDFSTRSPMTDEQIADVERLCREQIEADHQVFTQEVEQAEAREINTLRAVFGEKYPDRVRVVSIGAPITEEDGKEVDRSDWLLKSPENEKWMQYSVEFCGGTHLQRSGEAERFVLISEEGVGKGVRRVVGISGDAAKAAAGQGDSLTAQVYARVENPGDDLAEWLPTFQKNLDEAVIPVVKRHQIRDALVELQKIVKQRGKKQDAAAGGAVMEVVATLLESAEEVGGVTIVVGEVPQAPADQVRGAIDWVRQKCDASAVLLAMAGEGRVTLLAGMSKKAVERGLKAGDLIREIAPIVGGKGGGKPDLAQGGGKDPSKVPDALDRARSWLKSKLGPT